MKVFIKITKTYQVKNQLQKLILDNIQKLDFTLIQKNLAPVFVKQQYIDAVDQYKGKASVPELKSFHPNNKTMCIYVDDVIYVDLYDAINDKTE
jgi:hypothetical protein